VFVPEDIATFVFMLSFDPEYMQSREVITLNQDIVLDGQQLMVTTVEIYPTHKRVNFTDVEGNTAWLKSLNFYFINEKGERFETISNGISSIGTPDSPMTVSHHLESSFFSQSNSLTMFITDVLWLDKDMERIRINLADGSAEKLPEGVELKQATRQGNSWHLEFSSAKLQTGLFELTYYDEFGNEYMYNSVTSGRMSSGYYIRFVLSDYPYDVVYLMPYFSRFVELQSPVEVVIR